MQRRDFIKAGAVLGMGLSVPWIQPTTESKRHCRKSLFDIPPNAPDLVKYRCAVGIMKALDPSDHRSWSSLVQAHHFAAHENWWFLPWHRAFVFYFEEICRSVLHDDPSFKLPYWDWARSPFIPEPFLERGSPLWHKGRGSCSAVQNGFQRAGKFDIGGYLEEMAVGYVLGHTTDDPLDHAGVGWLDGTPHTLVHDIVGGDMAFIPSSPLDPLFWIHHCNVDRIWESWLTLHGRAVPIDEDWSKKPLGKFYDPVLKQCVSVVCVETVKPDSFGTQYDHLETISGFSPRETLPTAQILFGPGEELKAPGPTPFILPAQGDSAKTIGSRTSFLLGVTPQFASLLEKNPYFHPLRSRPLFPHFALLLDRVPFPKRPSTAIRVFVNARDASIATPLDDPGYVGTVGFFSAYGPTMDLEETSFSFNLGPNLARLKAAGRPMNTLEITLVSVDLVEPNAAPEALRPAKVRVVGFPGPSS